MTDKVTADPLDEFAERMDRTARFYQQAVMRLAEEQVADIQAAIAAQIYESSQPQSRFWQRVRAMAQNLFPVALGRDDPGRILPAVLQDREPVIEDLVDGTARDDSDNSAHASGVPQEGGLVTPR